MININAAPCFNMHLNGWQDDTPELPAGPIELYDPIDSGTEDLEADANFDVEFRAEYPTMMDAIRDIRGEMGRFMWSQPGRGVYLGFLNHCQGSVALVVY